MKRTQRALAVGAAVVGLLGAAGVGPAAAAPDEPGPTGCVDTDSGDYCEFEDGDWWACDYFDDDSMICFDEDGIDDHDTAPEPDAPAPQPGALRLTSR